MMVEAWPARASEALLRERDRVIVLFAGDWCPAARAFAPLFDAAEPEAVVPLARIDLRRALDRRWERYGIEVVPTLVYFEHGEELERCDGVPEHGLTVRDLEEFLETVASIQDEPVLPKRMHGLRRR